MSSLRLNNYTMYDLIPLTEAWLEQEGYTVTVLANRVEGVKKTGFFSSEKVTVFLEDYIGLCLVKMQGETNACARLSEYFKSLPARTPRIDRETIIREREIVTMPCPYCRTLVPVTERKCPNCGAYIKG